MKLNYIALILVLIVSACSSAAPTSTPKPTLTPTRTYTPTIPPTPTFSVQAFTTVTSFPTGGALASPTERIQPTLRPGVTELPTFTPVPFVTVTPFPTGDGLAAANNNGVALPLQPTPRPGVTLLPTFTPAPFVTVTAPPLQGLDVTATSTLRYTPTFDLKNPPPPLSKDATFDANCAVFVLDKAKSTLFVPIRAEVQLSWGAITGATEYRLWVRHPDGTFIIREALQKTEFMIRNKGLVAALYTEGVYPFEIVAYRGSEPICQHITDLLIVRGQ